jgi:hypothetical protein
MTPRKTSVSIAVGAGASPVDVTQDLVSFTYEENIKEAGETLDISLDDASKRYRSIWWIEKGTPIRATITTTDWNAPGDDKGRTTGVCWVDTLELEVKPAMMIIKATSISPQMLNDQDNHAGYESESLQSTVNQFAEISGSGTAGGLTNEPGDNDRSLDLANNRQDQDNQGNLKWRRDQAQKIGCEVMVVDNKIRTYRESDLEAKPATKVLTAGISPIIKGRFTTNSIGKYASAQVIHTDLKSGTKTTGNFQPSKPPKGTKSVCMSRDRSLQPGTNDNNTVVAGNPIGKGQPGNPFDTEAA